MLKLVPVGELKDHFPKGYKSGVVLHTGNIKTAISALNQWFDVRTVMGNSKWRVMVGKTLKKSRELSKYEIERAVIGREDTVTTIYLVPSATGHEISLLVYVALMVLSTLASLALAPKPQTEMDGVKGVVFGGSHTTSVVGSPLAYNAGKKVWIEKAQVIEAGVESLQNAGSYSGFINDGDGNPIPDPGTGGGGGGGGNAPAYEAWQTTVLPWWAQEVMLGGQGGGGGKQIANQNNSFARLSALLAIGGGECDGPYGATPEEKASNMFLDGTPIYDMATQTYQIPGLRWTYRRGVPGQNYVGITPGISTIRGNGAEEITKAMTTGLIKEVDHRADRAKLIIRCRLLLVQKDGDQKPTEVELAISTKRLSGQWGAPQRFYQKTKNSEGFDTDFLVPAPPKTSVPNEPWQFRIQRITADSTGDSLTNSTHLAGWNEVQDKDLRYDGTEGGLPTALVGIELNSANFGQGDFPPFSLYGSGRKIRVPYNYNTDTRTYSGFWDLSWKHDSCDNPVWLSYDMATCSLGGGMADRKFDPAQLLPLAKWCDEKVNGQPRYSLRRQYWQARPLFEHLQEVAKTFRAQWYKAGTRYVLVGEMANQPVRHTYNNDQAEHGAFEWSETQAEDQFNEIRIKWQNPAKKNKTSITIVKDEANIAKMRAKGVANLGVISLTVEKDGCTTEEEARYWGEMILFDALREKKLIKWTTGLRGSYLDLGERVDIMDWNRTGLPPVGRVRKVLSVNAFELDAAYPFMAGKSYKVSGMVGDEHKHFTVGPFPADLTTKLVNITAHGFVAETPINVVDLQGLQPFPTIVKQVNNIEPGKYEITLKEWREEKFAYVEGQPVPPPNNWPVIDRTIGVPQNFRGKPYSYVKPDGSPATRIALYWDGVKNATQYVLSHWAPSDGGYRVLSPVFNTFTEVDALEMEDHYFHLTAVNSFGDVSDRPALTGVPVKADGISDNYAPILKRIY